MRVTYDKEADAAYIYLGPKKKGVRAIQSMNENIILDFDKNKKLIGIEILSV